MSKPFDVVALRIGEAWRRGLAAHAEAGRLLIQKKAALRHGEFLPWIAANSAALGFNTDRTAQYLMKLARENPKFTSDLATLTAEATRGIRERLWGNLGKSRMPTPDAELDPQLDPHQTYEWYTPIKYVGLVKEVFGGKIDLDPASCPEANHKYVKARKFYTREQDGLTLPWRGKAYVNPPFQAPIMALFVDKLIAERANGNCREAIMLSNGATDTLWFHKVFAEANAVCFLKGRIPFMTRGEDGITSTPGYGGAFSYVMKGFSE
jgi:hypothetical protein